RYPWVHLMRHVVRQRGLRDDPTRDFHSTHETIPVFLLGEEVRPDTRAGVGIGAAYVDTALRLGPQLCHADGHARLTIEPPVRGVGIAGMHEEEPHIGKSE